MRSALICVFFALIVQKEGSRGEQDDDFKPTPIPLSSWSGEKQEPAGTLQEFIKTDAPPTVAALPAHYWEDALRHSVYLTLVRDKIDQLIAKGAVISADSKPDNNISKEVDDHDLWEKIKAAPFDRLKEDPLPPGDVIILARGRLLEEKNGYRFAEDVAFPEKCNKDNCTDAVKAYWSVKRVRQGETSPGKYHYELTFSVTSQATRKLKKPYENPVRTFTIKENTPTERPPTQYRNFGAQVHHDRGQRTIWVHKNIAPQTIQKRPASSRGLDRIFSTLFSDEDDHDDVPYRRKPHAYVPMHPYSQPNSKLGYINDRDPYHQKKVVPYPIKPQTFRYSRPPLPPPPPMSYMHPYMDTDQSALGLHTSLHPDNRYIPPNPIKTTKPAVLPTPISNFQLIKESSVDAPVRTTLNLTDYTTKEPELLTTTHKIHNNKPPPMKVSYFPENIRSPVYNAPPGVFVTMDKKPFKPMPPLKLKHQPKPHKTMPLDFRPSPQILDTQYSDTDSSADTAFRPITLNLTELFNSKKGPKNHRKPTTNKKPIKKHENIKSYRLTTISPDIITAHGDAVEDNDDMQWAEILGAFTKTTPMASQTEKEYPIDSDYITTTTASPSTTEKPQETTTTSTTTTTTTKTTTTTAKPKRTRPPPKFTKPDKIKKHKRITTTTTSTTTTAKPTRKYPVKKISEDLTPQASSAATSGANSVWETKHKGAPTITSSTSTTTTTSTSTTPTTTRTTTTRTSTTPSTTSTTTDTEPTVATTQPKSKNRFRQSTLMQKGTSVNHDKWSAAAIEKNRTTPITVPKFPLRRKASKFQGYIPSSTPRLLETERNREYHEDHAVISIRESSSTTAPRSTENVQMKAPTQPTVEKDETSDDPSSEWNRADEPEDVIEIDAEDDKDNDLHESNDDNEYIFPTTSTTTDDNSEKHSATEQTVEASSLLDAKNKTKCKKKKHHNLTTTENLKASTEIDTTTIAVPTSSVTTSTTVSAATPDIFEDLFGGFTMDDVTDKPKAQSTTAPELSQSESAKHEQFIHIDDDIEDFLHSLDQKPNQAEREDKSDEEYDDENDDEDSPFNNEEENLDSRNFSEDYYEDNQDSQAQDSQDRPFSLLELMAME